MAFQFRLQRVLDLAVVKERKKQNQLSSSRQREQVLVLYLEQARTELRRCLERIASDPASPLASVLIESVDRGQSDIRRMEATLGEERDAQRRLQAELVKLVMRRKAFEKLREKRFSEFRLEQIRTEQKRIDEVAGQRWKPRGTSEDDAA